MNDLQSIKDFRIIITEFEKIMLSKENTKIGHEIDEELCPLKHSFADGCYIREIFMPKGLIITSKIHKITHPFFILKGKCSVATENGIQEIEAPYSGLTKSGTKRAIFVHEDTIWITIHVTKEKDLNKIEEQIISKNFEEYDNYMINNFLDNLMIEKKGA